MLIMYVSAAVLAQATGHGKEEKASKALKSLEKKKKEKMSEEAARTEEQQEQREKAAEEALQLPKDFEVPSEPLGLEKK